MVSSIGSLSLKKDKTANRRGQASGNGDLLALLLPVISLSPAVSVWYRPQRFGQGAYYKELRRVCMSVGS